MIGGRSFALSLFGAVLSVSAHAADPVSIDGVWCVPSTGRPHTAYVYMTMTLNGKTDDTLIKAASSAAQMTDILVPSAGELIPTEALPLSAHAPTIFEPGGQHLILRALNRSLKPGDTIELTLTFAKAGKRGVSAAVVRHAPTADMPGLPKGVKLE